MSGREEAPWADPSDKLERTESTSHSGLYRSPIPLGRLGKLTHKAPDRIFRKKDPDLPVRRNQTNQTEHPGSQKHQESGWFPGTRFVGLAAEIKFTVPDTHLMDF